MRECLTATKAESKGIGTPWRLLLLAGLHTRAKQASNALDRIAEALSLMRSTGECRDEAELHRAKGEALLALSPARSVEAEACYHEALAVARGQSAKMWELRASTSLARLWRDQGRRAEGYELLAPVYNWFTEGFDTADLRDAKALLNELG
jgi:predicted ATPase